MILSAVHTYTSADIEVNLRSIAASHVRLSNLTEQAVPTEGCLGKSGDVRRVRKQKENPNRVNRAVAIVTRKKGKALPRCGRTQIAATTSAPLGIRDDEERARMRRNYILAASFVKSGRDY